VSGGAVLTAQKSGRISHRVPGRPRHGRGQAQFDLLVPIGGRFWGRRRVSRLPRDGNTDSQVPHGVRAEDDLAYRTDVDEEPYVRAGRTSTRRAGQRAGRDPSEGESRARGAGWADGWLVANGRCRSVQPGAVYVLASGLKYDPPGNLDGVVGEPLKESVEQRDVHRGLQAVLPLLVHQHREYTDV
jgi:hypothetical protein